MKFCATSKNGARYHFVFKITYKFLTYTQRNISSWFSMPKKLFSNWRLYLSKKLLNLLYNHFSSLEIVGKSSDGIQGVRTGSRKPVLEFRHV